MKSLRKIWNHPDKHIMNLMLKADKRTSDHRRKFGTFAHIELLKEMVMEYKIEDAKYVNEFWDGMYIVGDVATSGRWETIEDALPAKISVDDLDRDAYRYRRKVIGKMVIVV